MRAAAILIAGMLLFSVFGHAHAQTSGNQAVDDNYGLKRFSGDNYDSLPPGAGIAASQAPAPQQQPVYQLPPSSEPYGYKPLPQAAPQYPQGTTVTAASPYYQPGWAPRAAYD